MLVTPPETRSRAQYYAALRERRALTPAERYGEALVQMQNGDAAERGAHAAPSCRAAIRS